MRQAMAAVAGVERLDELVPPLGARRGRRARPPTAIAPEAPAAAS